jgi:hypothetical protein
MTHYIIHQFFQLNLKWWDIQIAAISTSLLTFFGKGIILFIDPEIARGVLTFLTAGMPLLLGAWTFNVAVRRGKKDLKKMEREQEQDEEEHLFKMMKEFEDRMLIDPNLPVEEKIARTKNLSKLLRQ